MLIHGIGLIQHVGDRKLLYTNRDKMIFPITHAFTDYKVGDDIESGLLKPLIKGLNEYSNQTRCSKVFKYFTKSIYNFIKISNKS